MAWRAARHLVTAAPPPAWGGGHRATPRRYLLGDLPAFFRRAKPVRPSPLQHLLDRNAHWSERVHDKDPVFFKSLSLAQNPEVLWIGCSDSRISANQVVDLPPGEVFVHRNIANVVSHSDFNCLSVLEYGVEILKVKHIIVCGHYGCGGVAAALKDRRLGLIDNWLRHIRDVREKHKDKLEAGLWKNNEARKMDMLCELNVIEQVKNVVSTTIVQGAWDKGQSLSVHGWIYNVKNGLIKDLGVSVTQASELSEAYRTAMDMEEVELSEPEPATDKETVESEAGEEETPSVSQPRDPGTSAMNPTIEPPEEVNVK